MFLAPPLLALAAHVLAGAVTKAPVDVGSFKPDSLLVMVVLSAAVVYAGLFMVLMSFLRTPGVSTFDKNARRGDVTMGTVVASGVFVWGMFFLFGLYSVGGAVNLAIGQVAFESGSVQDKHVTQGRGCHFHIDIRSSTVPQGRSLCVPTPDWRRLRQGDTLPIVTITSAWGQQVGLAPGALQDSKGHAP